MKINISKLPSVFQNLDKDIADENSQLNKLMNNVIISLVLKELSQQDKQKFYQLLQEDKSTEAGELIKNSIPNFSTKLSAELQKHLKKIV